MFVTGSLTEQGHAPIEAMSGQTQTAPLPFRGMTLAVPGATGFVALVQRAVIVARMLQHRASGRAGTFGRYGRRRISGSW